MSQLQCGKSVRRSAPVRFLNQVGEHETPWNALLKDKIQQRFGTSRRREGRRHAARARDRGLYSLIRCNKACVPLARHRAACTWHLVPSVKDKRHYSASIAYTTTIAPPNYLSGTTLLFFNCAFDIDCPPLDVGSGIAPAPNYMINVAWAVLTSTPSICLSSLASSHAPQLRAHIKHQQQNVARRW